MKNQQPEFNMKKFILSLIAAFVALAAIAQVGETTVNLNKDVYVIEWYGEASDTVSLVDTLWTKQFTPAANNASSYFYDFAIKLKEHKSGTGRTDCFLLGKKFNADAWTNIDTIKYYSTGTDTTIKFTQNTTKKFWNHYGIRLEKQLGTANVYPLYIYGFFKKQ
jgi:hypothetical protein